MVSNIVACWLRRVFSESVGEKLHSWRVVDRQCRVRHKWQ
jgi:hypothetical protein